MTLEQMSQSDNRRFPRQAYVGGVFLEDQNKARGEELMAFNLSQSGVGLHSPRQLGTGSPVELSFLGRNMSVKGVVRREAGGKPWQIGVEFNQPQPELVDVALTAFKSDC
jgi:hypothetical protein